MEISIGDELKMSEIPLPGTPFVAKHLCVTGPLCIVSVSSGISPASYNVMFLQGNGGPAIGDVWTGVPRQKIEAQFIPLREAVTLSNSWRNL